jgi:hypothetical protein
MRVPALALARRPPPVPARIPPRAAATAARAPGPERKFAKRLREDSDHHGKIVTPAPATTPAAQPDLTDGQIAVAIAFNKVRFDGERTKLVQGLIGTAATGTWVKADILAVAGIQESYGLKKDGMVGPATFRFLDKETSLEKLDTKDEHCLVSFTISVSPVTVTPVVGGQRTISAKFRMSAQLPKHCGCANYQYRQFIKGHWKRIRGGVTTDLGSTFTTLPAGGLNTTWQEDGNTATAALNYGHREQVAEDGNRYLDDGGAVDQAKGCRYEGHDEPGGPDPVLSGDVFDIQIDFRGEIQRKGRTVETKHWSPIKGRFPVP